MDQARLHDVVENLDRMEELGVAALALDAEDRTIRWNDGFLALFPEHAGRIHRGEPYAENLRRFYRGRLDAAEMALIERYVAEGVERHHRQVAPFEFLHHSQWLRAEVLPLPGGGRLRFWSRAAPARGGDVLATVMVASGKRVSAEALDQTADGLMVHDAEGRIVMANRPFAKLYGLDGPGEAIGRRFSDVLERAWAGAGDAREARQRWAENSRFPGAPFELPLPGDRWVRVREHRTYDGSWIGTHVDVTDLCRMQQSLAEARHRAEELARMLSAEMQERKRAEAQMVQTARLISLGQMATGLAHELNQPLAIMALAADNAILELQRRGPESIPAALKRLESIASSSIRARGVVDHLRLFGREDGTPASAEPVELALVVKGALLLAEAAIRSAGIALHVSLPDPPARVMGQMIPLEQVLLNLLLNARDAVQASGRPAGAIHLSVRRAEGEVVLTVADNGTGFSPAALARALEPFFTTKEAGKGTGLGLSLAYSTIRAMAGTMTLANADGGAVVRITLPELA
ncbi:ATP-binding protein [Sediminicoccus rosea]|uniref:histidine kinase n=1 Tax=Sediminicoccus rosea TaxID=1225128 RepID=A0ABZ0PCS6_9PROT|nr:ATP-binding protein [Sediminicoccus rosea]WPB83005.1 PAS-domain containing protein [Sediminicoccus rosea]